MSRNLSLALQLTARDTGSKVLRKAMQDAIQQTKAAEKQGDQLAKSQQQNASRGIQASRALQDEYRRAASARSTLGVRSEREIQREITQTQAAYMRLTRSGIMSANDQSRAFTAMTQKVGRLREELNGAGLAMSRMERARGIGSNALAIGGGILAGASVIAQPVKNQMSYERRLLMMSNTGFNDLSPEERIKKVPVMNNAIKKAVKYGGGTRETAAETLNNIFADGQVDSETAMEMLPSIMRYSTASGAAPQDLAKVASAAIALFGITKEQLPELFDKLIRSGENGSYELADMARGLPQQMSKGKALGMGGLKDIDKLLAENQANALTAGDNSAASTNINNLMDKIVSADIKNSLKNYKFRGKDGKALSYEQYLVSQRSQGVNTADANMKAITGIVESNKDYKALENKLNKYKGTSKEADLSAAMDVLVSSLVANIVADQQAGMALKTKILKRDFIKEQIAGTENSFGAGEAAFKVISSSNDFKTEQFQNDKDFAEIDSMKTVSDVLGRLSKELSDYSSQYPGLTTALAGAELGIKAMTAAAVVFGGIRLLQGGTNIGLPKTSSPIPGAANAAGISIPALYVTAGSVALTSTRDYLRDEFKNNDMSGKVSSIKAGTSGYSFVDIATEIIKNRWDNPSSGIKVPKVSSGSVDPFGSLPDTANFGVPDYLKRQPASLTKDDLKIHLTSVVKLDERTIGEAVSDYLGGQAARGPRGHE
ncbi:hypothetical protein JOE25_001840 [Serratia sp. PL17]|uniref:phage tail tape measure protein n=1 Tax=Serratia sp. PL17 TaxID=2806582 RepID=UPI001AE5026D|nr:phage tail tape measure protein [Serratia sp. PL17]MBP1130281.1 hypothetical protein [Serratia sp. PL17]